MSTENYLAAREKEFLAKSKSLLADISVVIQKIKLGVDTFSPDSKNAPLLFVTHEMLCEEYPDINQEIINAQKTKVLDQKQQLAKIKDAIEELTPAETIEIAEGAADLQKRLEKVKLAKGNTAKIPMSTSVPTGLGLRNLFTVRSKEKRRSSLPALQTKQDSSLDTDTTVSISSSPSSATTPRSSADSTNPKKQGTLSRLSRALSRASLPNPPKSNSEDTSPRS